MKLEFKNSTLFENQKSKNRSAVPIDTDFEDFAE